MAGRPVAARIAAELAGDAPGMAVAGRGPPEGRVRHSGHGPRHASLLPGKAMRDHGARPSMGSVASPWDNAVTESPMGIIKSGCVRARTFASREEAALEVFEYIECLYNRVRTRPALGRLSPEQFEREHGHDRLRAE